MQCGGPFYHISSEALSSSVLLIAAGVGINPMLSIYHDIYDTHVRYSSKSFGKTKMLYTATSEEELVFKVKGFFKFNCCNFAFLRSL